MPHLSKIFETYQRVKLYTDSVNDLGLKIFYSNMDFTGNNNKSHRLRHYNLCKGGNIFLQLFFLSMGSISILL